MAEEKKEQVISLLPLINLMIEDKQYSFLFPHGSTVDELDGAAKALSDKLVVLRAEVAKSEAEAKIVAEAKKEETVKEAK